MKRVVLPGMVFLLAFSIHVFAGVPQSAPAPAAGMGTMMSQMGAMGKMDMMQACPMKMPGVKVAVADTSKGADVTFTVPDKKDVAELQNRVQRMAKMHEMMPANSGMPMGSVKYEARKDGARMMMTPGDPAKMAEFRKQVHAHVEEMKKGECSMMEKMMQGMKAAPANNGASEHDGHHPADAK